MQEAAEWGCAQANFVTQIIWRQRDSIDQTLRCGTERGKKWLLVPVSLLVAVCTTVCCRRLTMHFVLQASHHALCVAGVSPCTLCCRRLTMHFLWQVRWDRSKPATVDNLLLLSEPAATEHLTVHSTSKHSTYM